MTGVVDGSAGSLFSDCGGTLIRLNDFHHWLICEMESGMTDGDTDGDEYGTLLRQNIQLKKTE